MRKLFVWDFHGVLEKGNDEAVVEITNHVLEQHGYKRKMAKQEAMFLSGKRWHEYFAFLLPGLNQEEYHRLQSTCVSISQSQPQIIAKHIQLNDHAEHVLEKIASSLHTQILISNTQPQSLDLFVKLVGVEKFFPSSHRFAVDTHYQPHLTKKECLDNFLENKFFPGGMVSIGDSPGDMTLIHQHSKGIGYLYTHPDRMHRIVESHYKIHDLREILQEI